MGSQCIMISEMRVAVLICPRSEVLGVSVHCHVQVDLHTGLQERSFMHGAMIRKLCLIFR